MHDIVYFCVYLLLRKSLFSAHMIKTCDSVLLFTRKQDKSVQCLYFLLQGVSYLNEGTLLRLNTSASATVNFPLCLLLF